MSGTKVYSYALERLPARALSQVKGGTVSIGRITDYVLQLAHYFLASGDRLHLDRQSAGPPPSRLRGSYKGILCGLAFLIIHFGSLPAWAQYERPAEVFAGYSYIDFEPGRELESAGMNGWNVALNGYVNEWLGFAADLAGHYGTTAGPLFATTPEVDVEQWSYMFGPHLRLVRTPRFAASVRTVFGASRGDADPDTFLVDDRPVRLSVKQTKFAGAFGVAVDVNLTPRLAWRVQPELFLTSFSGERQQNFRFATGIVFRFSERQ